MEVLLINGSPRKNGSTTEMLDIVSRTLEEEGIGSRTIWLGTGPSQDCVACRTCMRTGKERCVFDDEANRIIEAMEECDGLIVGCPVYFAHPTGRILSVLDRAFYAGGSCYSHKPAAAITVARRAGTTATVDVLNKYFSIAQMPIVSSTYWNMAHGSCGEEIHKDEEGVRTLKNLAHNMAWILRSIEAGKKAGVPQPKQEPVVHTNFIR